MAGESKDFLGRGWSFPPTFSRASASVVTVANEQDIYESLWVLFSTIPGERIMLPEYGCDIWSYVFRAINTTQLTEIEQAVKVAVLDWEPRVDIDNLSVTPDNELEGKVSISIDYTIRQTNTRSNLVYPFYLNEGTLVSAPTSSNLAEG